MEDNLEIRNIYQNRIDLLVNNKSKNTDEVMGLNYRNGHLESDKADLQFSPILNALKMDPGQPKLHICPTRKTKFWEVKR